MANWRRFRELSWTERGLLGQGLVLLPLMTLALWTLGFRRWQAALSRLSPIRTRAGKDKATLIGEGRATARLVDAAARHGPYRASCLPRSLTLWWLLRRRGIDGDLRIGVRKLAGQFQAHAWVEYHGAVLNDWPDVSQRFAAFARSIAPSPPRCTNA
jgi:hypothetical protein